MDEQRIDRCRQKLYETAIAGARITYGELGKHIDVPAISIGKYLNVIYEREMAAERPDVTLLVKKKGAKFGPFNSRGASAQTIAVDSSDADDRRDFNAELQRVYDFWRGKRSEEFRD
jgi:hypothetical protein